MYRVNHTSSSNPHVKVYALISRHGNVQLVILHKDATASYDALVTLKVAVPVKIYTAAVCSSDATVSAVGRQRGWSEAGWVTLTMGVRMAR